MIINVRTTGDVLNALVLLCTVGATYALIYRFPNESLYDSNWLSHGFCVSQPESTLWNSHTLSFYSDSVMSVLLTLVYALYFAGPSTKSSLSSVALKGSITGVFFHGLGHLYLGVRDAAGIDFRWNGDNLWHSIVNKSILFGALAGIMRGSLSFASPARILSFTAVFTWGLSVLGVPPQLNFVYVQAVILIGISLHMLMLDPQHKQTSAYPLYALLRLPVLLVGLVESMKCQDLLEPWGGHVVYDTTISIAQLLTPILALYFDSRSKHSTGKLA